jgi:hypothetical protein
MKKLLLIGIFASVASILCVQSQTNERLRKGYLEFGLSSFLLQPSDGEFIPFIGMAFGGGGYISKNSYVGGEIGIVIQASEGEQVGTFTYTSTNTLLGQTTTHHDGKITRQFTAVPILGLWAYDVRLSDKVYFNVGPVLGTTIFTESFRFEPSVSNTPEMPKTRKTAFNFGGEIGLKFDLSDNIVSQYGIGLKYRLLKNIGADFNAVDMNGIAHRIGFSIYYVW